MTKAKTPRLSGRRSQGRRIIAAPASVLASPELAGTVLADISSHGCRVTGFAGSLTVGAPVSVRPAGLPAMTAWVRWIMGREVGLEFARPLPSDLVDRLAAVHRVPVEFDSLAA